MRTELRKVSEELSYTLTRKKVKNINLRVKPEGVFVSAARNVPVGYIDDFVRSKADFIRSALRRMAEERTEKEPSADTVYSGGSELIYLGKKYRVDIVKGDGDTVEIDGGRLVITTYDEENLPYIQKLVRNWLYNRTAELFRRLNDETYEEFSRYYKVPHAAVQIKTMKTRWGSCHIADGVLSMNSRLIYYPEEAVRYVFIHEYAHFIVPNHSAEFYAVVARFMPDYRLNKNLLR
ncbi:MAG: M48 family metallopeptidase [Oscillospiraceae bacterium]